MGLFLSDELNDKGHRRLRGWISWLIVFVLFAVAALIFVGNPLIDKYREANPIDKECQIESAEVFNSRSGTGGISTSSTELKIDTVDCGTVYVSKVLSPSPAQSWEQMAAEVNERAGESVVLVFPPFQFPAEGDYALGYGYRL